ncbi:fimbrial protein [Burkholderia sp. R-70006]|nr:fimbrial protein [Paraburkholderia domus]MBK5050877.1 fimbrial protein [Burkholderia sp. R-70006]
MTGVYPTNVAGVGMRMRDSKGTPLVGTGYCSTTSSLGNTAADGSFTVSGTFELVATGSIQGGTISGALYNTGILNTGVTLNNGNSNMSVASGTAIRPVTCSVDPASANQRVPLATVSPTMFAGAGSTAATTPFSINLVCQAGVNVAVTFSSATGTSGVPTVLASNGTATGIGVQLLNALNTPITLDSPLLLTSATTGNTSFQFFAQYYRLGATGMTPGRVNAAAIFTMNYQ